jgi:hypothetical protein
MSLTRYYYLGMGDISSFWLSSLQYYYVHTYSTIYTPAGSVRNLSVLATHRSGGQTMSQPHLGTGQAPGTGFLSGRLPDPKSDRNPAPIGT